jgi:ABC-type lipoprotein release transport system permease subunit
VVENAPCSPPTQHLKSIDQWQAIGTQTRALPEVKVGLPAAAGSVLVVRGSASRAISVLGIDPEPHYRIIDLDDKVLPRTARQGGSDISFGIASVLVVSVVQRSREIGILRAMGVSQGQMLRAFLLQGGLLGGAGSVLGCAIGALSLPLWQRWARNADGTPMFGLTMDSTMFSVALLLATLTGLAAAFAPAPRAARIDPVVAIRG